MSADVVESGANSLLGDTRRVGGLIEDLLEILDPRTLSSTLNANLDTLRRSLQHSDDLIIKRFQLGPAGGQPAAAIYLQGLTDTKLVSQSVLEPLVSGKTGNQAELRGAILADTCPVVTLRETLEALVAGRTVVLVDGSSSGAAADTSSPPGRSIERPQTQASIIGPMESFTEDLGVNIGLLRRRLKTPQLAVEKRVLGKRSLTETRVIYVGDVASPTLVQTVCNRLDAIDTDVILASGEVRNLIAENPYSVFPLMELTERPDTVAASLSEGRVAITVDGDPFMLLVPSSLFHAFGAAEDHYDGFFLAAAMRALRIGGFMLATFLTATYVAIVGFHPLQIPLPLLLNIAATGLGTPFPLPLAALLVEFVLEIIREAGIRLPRQLGQAASIVGAIVLGQAAIQSGFVPPALVIISSLAAIASFTVPGYGFTLADRLLRFPIIVMASILGFFGVLLSFAALLLYLSSLSSFGYPLLAFPGLLIKRPTRDRRSLRPYAGLDRTRGLGMSLSTAEMVHENHED